MCEFRLCSLCKSDDLIICRPSAITTAKYLQSGVFEYRTNKTNTSYLHIGNTCMKKQLISNSDGGIKLCLIQRFSDFKHYFEFYNT